MKDMNEKNIKLEEEFKKLKNEWLQEAKKILETEYPRRDGQLDGECTVQMAKLQKKYKIKIKELREKYKQYNNIIFLNIYKREKWCALLINSQNLLWKEMSKKTNNNMLS